MTSEPSGRLYSAVTKYWPRIAVSIVATVGVAGWVIEGLTADSGIEFYLMAWGATTGGLWFMFEKAEKALSDESRAKVVGWVHGTDFRGSLGSIPGQFAVLFDRVFGERHLSRRCFNRSCVASLAAVFVVFALGLTLVGTPALPSAWSGVETAAFTLVILAFGSAMFNWIPDYISLLETRLVLRWMERSGRG